MKPVKLYRTLYRGLINYFYFRKLSNGTPIIIGGCGRSGTTLLLSILAAHPEIHGINIETGIFSKNRFSKRSRFWTLYNLSAELYLDKKITAKCWMEKTPRNINNLEGIFNFFSNKVKVIHIVRDGRNVVTSKHPSIKDQYWVSFERWVNDVSNGLKFSDNPNVLLVKYEDLVNQFHETIKSILDFLDLELANEVYDYANHTTVKYNNAWDSKVKKLYNTKSRLKSSQDMERINSFMTNDKVVELMKKLNYID